MKRSLENSLMCLFIALSLSSFAQLLTGNSKEFIYPFQSQHDEVLSNHISAITDGAAIIGLGEVSHYTKECYELKHQIIKTLINQGYDALVLEVDFGQAVLWNDYVTNGNGNIDSLIAESGWFTYRTQEFKNLLIDVRNHNLTADQPFQVFGMEMTAMHNNLPWLENYLSEHSAASEELVALLIKEQPVVAFQQHSRVEVMDYWNLYYELSGFLSEHRDELINSGGEKNYATAQRISEITRQYATYISQDEFMIQVELRDQFSSRNVMWCMEQLGEDSQIAIWAHNGHVVKESVLFGYDILGYYLSKWFGDEYYSIGFTFNQGEFGAYSSNGFKKWELPSVQVPSLTKELAEFNSPYLLFDIRRLLHAEPDLPLFEKSVPIRTDVSESFNDDNNPMMEIDLSNSYDCLIYIDHTNYPTTIEWKQ
ncbi:erythromycin esterase family protein [Cryomorphaceae bacterium 1068]|nr:erythromycin esterase family protein [Cryomorphaceae bacterium 1068]